MSNILATRCSACGTVFRVVPDQLRVSDGWVRCGRCAEVFNAAQSLLDAQTGEPRAWPDTHADPRPAGLPEGPGEGPGEGNEEAPVEAQPEAPAEAQPEAQSEAQTNTTPATPPPATPELPTEPSWPVFTAEADLAPSSQFEATQILEPSATPESSGVERPATPVGPVTTGPASVPLPPQVPTPKPESVPESEPILSPVDPTPPTRLGSGNSAAPVSFTEPISASTPEAAAPPFDVEAMIDSAVDPQPDPFFDPVVQTPEAEAAEPEPPLFTSSQRAAAASESRLDRTEPPFAPTDSFSATPSFVRRAERAERWRRPRVRAALVAMLLLGLLGLTVQVAYVWRDVVAARLAFTRPMLQQGCAWLGCTVGPARVASDLTIESSGLLRVGETDAYQLQIAVRNQSDINLAMPALELSLTDTQGKLLARRVLRVSELGASQPAVAAGRDLQLQATLRITTEPVAGYTVLLFYP